MPIEFTPPRRLLTAYLRLRDRLHAGEGGETPLASSIKPETIEAVNDDGTYRIHGRNIGTAGLAQLNAGEVVDVAWKNGRPETILAHNARRAQFSPVSLPVGSPVVEELFVAKRPDDNITDLWFRNFDQCIPLHLERFGITVVTGDQPRWGPTNEFFYIRTSQTQFYVLKFKRRPFTPFTPGVKADQQLELVRTYDTTLISAPVFTMNATNQPGGPAIFRPSNFDTPITRGPVSPISSWTASLITKDFSLDTNGELIVACILRVGIVGAQTVDGPTVQPCGQTEPATVRTFVSLVGGWPIVINLARQTTLYDGFTAGVSGASASPLQGSAYVYNTLDLLAIPGTWTLLAEVIDTNPIDPCFNQVVGVAYCFTFGFGGATDHTLVPILTQGVTPNFANVMNGYMVYLVKSGEQPPESRFFYGTNPPET